MMGNADTVENGDVHVDSQFDLHFREPSDLAFQELSDGRRVVTVVGDRSCIGFRVARAFPLTLLDKYISIQDATAFEVAILRTLDGLDEDARRIVDDELERGYFIPQVKRVIKLRDEFGMQVWTVDTDRGEIEFVVREPRDRVKFIGPSRIMITDVDDNRYEIRDYLTLDRASVRLVENLG
jgi:hypothetical protein